MNKNIKALTLILVISFFSIAFLLSHSSRDRKNKNGFNRLFIYQQASLKESINLDNDDYSIADILPNHIILYRLKQPSLLIKISFNLRKIRFFTLPLPKNREKITGVNSIRFYNSKAFLMNGGTSYIYKADSISKSRLDIYPFYHADLINSSSFLIMTKKSILGINRRILKKVNLNGKTTGLYMPEKQKEGIFSNDGQFKYDKVSNKLIYMFCYRGEFVCLDSNMKIIYKAKTIDTVRNADLETKLIKEPFKDSIQIDKIIISKPPLIINRTMSITSSKIYINSNLKADNEDYDKFRRSQVIDIYESKDGQYAGSFYISKFGARRITEFRVYNNIIVAIYQKSLVIYEINE